MEGKLYGKLFYRTGYKWVGLLVTGLVGQKGALVTSHLKDVWYRGWVSSLKQEFSYEFRSDKVVTVLTGFLLVSFCNGREFLLVRLITPSLKCYYQ